MKFRPCIDIHNGKVKTPGIRRQKILSPNRTGLSMPGCTGNTDWRAGTSFC